MGGSSADGRASDERRAIGGSDGLEESGARTEEPGDSCESTGCGGAGFAGSGFGAGSGLGAGAGSVLGSGATWLSPVRPGCGAGGWGTSGHSFCAASFRIERRRSNWVVCSCVVKSSHVEV